MLAVLCPICDAPMERVRIGHYEWDQCCTCGESLELAGRGARDVGSREGNGDPCSIQSPLPIPLDVLIEQLEYLFEHRQARCAVGPPYCRECLRFLGAWAALMKAWE